MKLMDILKEIDGYKWRGGHADEEGKLYGYHVTNESNLKSIKKTGLESRVPEDYGDDGDVEGVYLFKTYDDCINALMNWLGERIEEIEEESGEEYNEIILKVDLTGLESHLIDSVEYEWTCTVNISPDRIVDIDWQR